MKYYQFLYYNLVKLWSKKKDEVRDAPINGIITITFFLYMNIMSIPLLLMFVCDTSVIPYPHFNKYYIALILFIFAFFNYWLLLRKGKTKEIFDRFNKLDNRTLKIGYRLTIFYLILSASIPLTILLFIPSRP
jgi:hypothetical protein